MKYIMGLSPRVRGNPRLLLLATKPYGSIPACAGEPAWQSSWGRSCTVYPRVCGGTKYSGAAVTSLAGLSPRVRGNHAAIRDAEGGDGSIPACAGEPRTYAPRAAASTVYPRVCGGTALPASKTSDNKGLSPRVRGNHLAHVVGGECEGSIPACAGEPLATNVATFSMRVYPRVCRGTQPSDRLECAD